MGIEPTWPAWKTGALPLSYARRQRWWAEQDSNLRRRCRQIYSLLPLATRASAHIFIFLELAVGIGPTTCGLQNRRSTFELR